MKIERQKYTMEQLHEFAEYLNDSHSLAETAKHFNINYDTLKVNLTKHGLRKPIRKVSNPTIKINDLCIDYFKEINTHEKAYFLGLMYSDGYIQSTAYENSKIIGIALKLEDKYILEKFKEELQIKTELKDYKNSSKLSITNKGIYDDLVNLGVVEDKSHSDIVLPPISKEFMNSFILGHFDGDGCITIKSSGAIVVSICCNSEIFLKSMQDFLNEVGIETNIRNEQGKRKNPLYILYFKGRKNQLKLKNFMYKDSNCYLKRKYEKFLEIPC